MVLPPVAEPTTMPLISPTEARPSNSPAGVVSTIE